MGDGGYDEFLDAYEATLSYEQSQRFEYLANFKRQCARETAGLSCEMSRSLHAAQRLHLFYKMVAFGCRTVKCEEAASCSRFPRRQRPPVPEVN